MYSFKDIQEQNAILEQDFRDGAIMKLLDNIDIYNRHAIHLLMACIQPLSDNFQKCVMTRHTLNENPRYTKITKQHFDEEYDHNTLLKNDSGNIEVPWDPILDATTTWFCHKMITLDNLEKHFLMHNVLEKSADIFFTKANKIISKAIKIPYFELHDAYDEGHAQMGLEFYEDLNRSSLTSLAELQTKGWLMMNSTCNRIAEIYESHSVADKVVSCNTIREHSHG